VYNHANFWFGSATCLVGMNLLFVYPLADFSSKVINIHSFIILSENLNLTHFKFVALKKFSK
jgi:hypothetical protein